jgi:phosphoglycerol transferase MdoB-like AlkP superfamily enzyme
VQTIGVSLAILGIIVVLLLLVEVRSFRTRRTLITRRRLVLRLAAGAMLLALLSAVFVGLFVLRLVDAQSRPQFFLAYWSGCLLIAVALVWAMLTDLRQVEDEFNARRHEIWHDMARFVADQMKTDRNAKHTTKGQQRE